MDVDALFDALRYESFEPVGLQNPESQFSSFDDPEGLKLLQG